MAFTPLSSTTFKNVVALTNNTGSALSVTAGQLIKANLSTGALESCTTTTTQNEAVFRVVNTASVAASATFDVVPVGKDASVFIVDTANNSNAAHNGQRMIITAGGLTLTNTGTDVSGSTGMFAQIGVVGAAADKKILAVRA
ncbi:hypothetical protein EKK58_11185 [Candidatus Dependentiae bacterium]|nr:MAG: hypothetical protein EKK58_11185 [Candidatus Dependentiae bacterium]